MSKTKLSISTFSSILGIAGIEHGVGEILQGNIKPDSFFIKSWPNNKHYDILAGEPAVTILTGIPIFITGIIAILISALIIFWAIFYAKQKHSVMIFIGLVVSLFLFGGGIAGPLLMGTLLCWAVFKMNSGFQQYKKESLLWKPLKSLWKIVFPIAIIGWFSLWPGLVLLSNSGISLDAKVVYILSTISFVTFVLTIISALAYDNLENIKK